MREQAAGQVRHGPAVGITSRDQAIADRAGAHVEARPVGGGGGRRPVPVEQLESRQPRIGMGKFEQPDTVGAAVDNGQRRPIHADHFHPVRDDDLSGNVIRAVGHLDRIAGRGGIDGNLDVGGCRSPRIKRGRVGSNRRYVEGRLALDRTGREQDEPRESTQAGPAKPHPDVHFSHDSPQHEKA